MNARLNFFNLQQILILRTYGIRLLKYNTNKFLQSNPTVIAHI